MNTIYFIKAQTSNFTENLTSFTQNGFCSLSQSHLKKRSYPALSVLLVDDDPIVQQAQVYLLKKLNCKVDVAADGYEALKMMRKTYQIIILDMQMPGLSGIETAIKIREQYKLLSIPIIGVTANYSQSLKEVCEKIGFKTVLRKPVDIEVLQRALKQCLKK